MNTQLHPLFQRIVNTWIPAATAYDLAADAADRLASGYPSDWLVHILYHPDGSIQGLSTPLPAHSDLSGHTERYYPLGHFAN